MLRERLIGYPSDRRWSDGGPFETNFLIDAAFDTNHESLRVLAPQDFR